jgi:hypothetical protein
MRVVHTTTLAVLCVATVVLLSACGIVQQPTAPMQAQPVAEITLHGHDHRFEAPDELPAGRVTLTFRNQGREPHHAQVARLNDGVTHAQVVEATNEGLAAIMKLVTFHGGPSSAEANRTAQATIDLVPGQYVLLCFIPGPDGVSHMAKGMVAPFTVRDEQAVAEVPTPAANQTISLYDFHYTMPETLPSGRQTWQIVNDGPQIHELALFKLTPGKTVDDFLLPAQSVGSTTV